MTNREHWEIDAPPGGWAHPWPLAVEVARALPEFSWTLVGGLMVQVPNETEAPPEGRRYDALAGHLTLA